jgi:hypothetical protein
VRGLVAAGHVLRLKKVDSRERVPFTTISKLL